MRETIYIREKKRAPLFFRILIIFLCLVGASALLITFFDVEFGQTSYWDVRGIFFLFFITVFPRLTLLFSSVVSGGWLWWLGWLFVPRILVAVLATVAYFKTNPILVIISWLVALSGESSEKYVIQSRTDEYREERRRMRDVRSEVDS